MVPFKLLAVIAVFLAIAIFVSKSKRTIKGKSILLPYVKKPYLMTNAEREFFIVLQQAVGGKYYIVPQVQLSNLVQVEKTQKWHYEYTNRIHLKSVDFVLFDRTYFTPQLVIELDDSSHARVDRQTRDHFLDEVLAKAGIKIAHIKTASHYNLNEIENMINTHKKQIHILHTDDDPFILDLYKPLFEKEGYKVTDIRTLDKDFIQQVVTINPDLIISDITKPDVNGIEFLRALKADERTKHIPFIFLSNSGKELDPELEKLGAIAHLVKAELKPREVIEKVGNLVREPLEKSENLV